MGKPVTVDSDDLDRILKVTGAHKQIEQILHQQKGDPFIDKDQYKLAEAHDRLAAECRRATRGELHPDYDRSISPDAFQLLIGLSGKISMVENGMMKNKLYCELVLKGMLEWGNGYDVICWANTREHQRINPVPNLMRRVTPRGQNLLFEMETKEKSITQ